MLLQRCLVLATVLAAFFIAPWANAGPSPQSDSDTTAFTLALSPLGLTTADMKLSAESIALWGGDKYKLNMLDFMRADVLRTGPYTRSLGNTLIANKDNLGMLVTSCHSRLDNGIRLGLVGDQLAKYRARIAELGPQCLAVALSELTAQPATVYSTDPQYVALPQPVREAAALVLFTVPEAQIDRQLGLVDAIQQRTDKPELYCQRIIDFAVNTFEEEDNMTGNEELDDRDDARLVEDLLDAVDWNLINRSSTLLAIATQEAYKTLTFVDPAGTQQSLLGDYVFKADTSLGTVVLRGTESDTSPVGSSLLLIDTGGQEHYGAVASTDYDHAVSIAIDLAGDDTYGETIDTVGTLGAGLFGTGILLDASGSDTYSCQYYGEGAGIFGTGALYDLAGNDVYSSGGYSQASGTFGSGLLADLGGDDVYNTYKYSQAYGGTRGCGILLDVDGDDHYLANMTDHFNGGLYGPTHHVHFVQGSAYGRRADFIDGHSWAGGCGILCDGAGNDEYVADCYGQGNAYWHSVGMLIDRSGNDVYRAGQYSQASAPHFACGVLQDDAGDDRYIISIRQSMAHGRDWSLAWLEDSAGNDWYQGARTTLGVSHVNSISVFWDKLGDDTYIMKGPGLGDSEPEPNGSLRDWLLTLGLFIDGAGHDGYYLLPGDESYEGSNTFSGEITADKLPTLQPIDGAGDGMQWQRIVKAESAPGYVGIGVDLNNAEPTPVSH
jgi:hypothetical protein